MSNKPGRFALSKPRLSVETSRSPEGVPRIAIVESSADTAYSDALYDAAALLVIAAAAGVVGVLVLILTVGVSAFWLAPPALMGAIVMGWFGFGDIAIERSRAQFETQVLCRFDFHDVDRGAAKLTALTQAELRVVASWTTRAAQLFCDRAPEGPFTTKAAIVSATVHDAPAIEAVLRDLARTGSTLTVDGSAAVQVIVDAMAAAPSPRVTTMIDRLYPVLRRELEPYADAALADLRAVTDRASRAELLGDSDWAAVRAEGNHLVQQLRDIDFHSNACDRWPEAVAAGQQLRAAAVAQRDDDTAAVLESFVNQRFPRNPLDLGTGHAEESTNQQATEGDS